jgi:hypothetical protein
MRFMAAVCLLTLVTTGGLAASDATTSPSGATTASVVRIEGPAGDRSRGCTWKNGNRDSERRRRAERAVTPMPHDG